MKSFLYQIKGKNNDSYMSNWAWPPIWTDKVEANTAKEAKEIIEAIYDRKFPLRVLRKDLESNEFLLVIKEITEDDKHTQSLFIQHTCEQCAGQFRIIEKYQNGIGGGGSKYCSRDCESEAYKVNKLRVADDNVLNGQHKPVIYKITNKVDNKCYIGKTTQAFTLRWYQHFFQGCGTKFHDCIKLSKLEDWTFEILEVVVIPEEMKKLTDVTKLIFERECFYINQFDSINNGYNTVVKP
jgi:hypothetical protein